MISAVDLRSGMRYVDGDDLIEVLEANHHKPGKGNTVMRMKLKNVRSGAIYETTLRPDEKFEQAYIDTRDVQFLYSDGTSGVFMDLETYEQYELPLDNIEEEMQFLIENSNCKIQFFGEEVIGVELPTSVNLHVTETEPRIKGATASGTGGKPATLETGLTINVPDFIEKGELIEVSTSNGGEYKGRVN